MSIFERKTADIFLNSRIIYCFFLLFHVSLIWALPYFPTQDGPCHLYNLTILKDLLEGGRVWGDFFSLEFRISPNLGFLSIALPLYQIFNPLFTEKIFLTIYIISFGASLPFFLKCLGKKIFPFALFALPVLLNHSLMMGFYSYSISIPLLLLCIGINWKYRFHPWFFKLLIVNFCGVVLFFFHLISFCIFIICIFNICFIMKKSSLFSLNMLRRVGIILPCLLIFLIYMMSQNAIHYSLDVQITDPASLKSILFIFFRRWIDLMVKFFLFSTYTFSQLQLIFASIFSFIIVLLSYESIKTLKRQYSEKKSLAESDQLCVMILIALSLIYFFTPARWGIGNFFNERFPWVILLFAIPLFSNLPSSLLKKATTAFLIVAISFVVINSAIFYGRSSQIGKALLGTNIGISPGTYMMTYKKKDTISDRIDHMLHIASYYGLYNRLVDVGNYQAFFGKSLFPVAFKNDSSGFPTIYQIENAPEDIKWELYPKIKYLAFVGAEDGKGNRRIRYFFRKIFAIDGFSIWTRKESQEMEKKESTPKLKQPHHLLPDEIVLDPLPLFFKLSKLFSDI